MQTDQELRRLFLQITKPFEVKRDYRPYLNRMIRERRRKLGYLDAKTQKLAQQRRIWLEICRGLSWEVKL